MIVDDELMESFFSEAEEWGEQFVSAALKITGGGDGSELIGEIFRGVHSLKGGASFLSGNDKRLKTLGEFCHEFETFLGSIRDGNITLDSAVKELVAKGLNILVDDISTLSAGKEITSHKEFLSMCNDFDQDSGSDFEVETPLVKIKKTGNKLLFEMLKPIRTVGEVSAFENLLRSYTFREGGKADVVIKLEGQSVLPSLAIGSIIGIQMYTNSMTIIGLGSDTVIERFGLKNMGITLQAAA